MLGDNGDLNFTMKLRKFISDKCFNDFQRLRNSEIYKTNYGYMYAYFESGAVGIARYWLSDTSPDRKSPEEVALLMEKLFTVGVYGFDNEK